MKLTIGARLLISFGLLVGFAAIIALYSIESAENAMLRLVGDKTTMVAEDAMARINHDLHIRIAELRKEVEREMADKIQRESGASAAMDAKGPQNGRNALDDFISHYTITFGYPVFTGVALLDKSGETIAAAGSGSLLRLDQAVRRRLMMNHAVYIGRPRVDPGADILAAPVAIPVFSRTGEVVGAAHALVALKALTDSVQLLIKKFETSRSYLFTGRGELIYSTTPFRFLEDMSRSKAYLAVASRGGDYFIDRIAGKNHLFASSGNLAGRKGVRTDWFFMIATDMEEILKPLLDLKIKIAFVSLLLITISVMVAVFMSRSLSRPLRKLALGVARFEGGRLADCIRIQGIPELENLAHAFNKMAKRRLRIEKDLSRAREKLEERVEERTAELLRTNVSLQKEMKERREVEDRLHRLFQNSLTGIAQHELLFDENGAPADFRVIDVNPAYTRILGITRDEAVGAKASELYQSDPPPYFDVFSQVALGGEPRTFETWFAPMDKHFNIGVYSPGQGMFATVFEDIGKRKRGEVLLADALTKAEEANRAKSDFLANMSHELRTPLNAILGFAQIFLADKKLDRSVHEKAGLIKKSGEHLLTIINDVLDISKIEAGRLDVLPGPVCLPRFIRTIRNIFYEQARKKEITFELAMDEELPEWIEADKTRLRQVLINLLGNAVKFTRRGRVSLRVEDRGRVGNERASICFRIEDTGVGIPLEQQEIIFHPFEQAEEMKLKTEGTGLGLAISNELVRLMGGTLHLESAPGKGSIFSFDLVFRLSTARDLDGLPPDAIDITGYKGKKRTILIIDDNAANRKVMEDMLVPLGFETAHAGHGRDVLQRCRKIRPDIVFMDLVMPDIDGFEATEAIRRVFGPDRLPIIAFSASTMAQYREKALAAGCNGFLAKPVSRSELLDILQHHSRIEWLHETAAPPAGESNETRKALTAPPPGELAELHKLALYGNMRKIIAWAGEKAGGDPSMAPFSDRLIAMAKEYQEQKMLRFIEGLMEAEKKDPQPG